MSDRDPLYSPDPNPTREIIWVSAACVALSAVIAIVMSYAP